MTVNAILDYPSPRPPEVVEENCKHPLFGLETFRVAYILVVIPPIMYCRDGFNQEPPSFSPTISGQFAPSDVSSVTSVTYPLLFEIDNVRVSFRRL